MPFEAEDISLEELEKRSWFSIRAIYVCNTNKLKGLNDIMSFYQKNGSFKKLTNCNRKIEMELTEVCKNFGNDSIEVIKEEIKECDEVKKMIRLFTKNEIEATNRHVTYLISQLSVRAGNGIQTLFSNSPHAFDLIDKIYSPIFSFRSIRHIGDKTVKELDDFKDVLHRYLKKTKWQNYTPAEVKKVQPEIIPDLETNIVKIVDGLNSFKKTELDRHIKHLVSGLTVRAQNGIARLFGEVYTAKEIIEKIYSPSFEFQDIRNIGSATVLELNRLKNDISSFIEKLRFIEDDRNREYAKIIDECSPFKKAALDRHIEYLVSKLKIRARNGLTQYFGEPYSVNEIIATIYSSSFDFQDIRNIGSKTVLELNEFKEDISSFIEKLKFIEDARLSVEYAKLIIKTHFNNIPIDFNEQFERVFVSAFDNTGKVKIFKFIYLLIENGYIFNPKERSLFHFLYTEAFAKSIDQIAIELDVSRERLRQIRTTITGEIKEYFQFVLNFSLQDLFPYEITKDACLIIIDKGFAEQINLAEDVKYKVVFYGIIFDLFLENSHTLLGDNETVSGKEHYGNTIRFRNCYIIENAVFSSFDFRKFTQDVNVNLSIRIAETYRLHFEDYLLRFINQEGKQYLTEIKRICEAIIYNEFDLVINKEGYIVFERNVKKPLVEYILEVLETFGQMTKVEAITKAINQKYPGVEINEQSVRSTLQRNAESFIFIGRTSTYGLKKWELENDMLRGGTIRDLAEEYLEKHDTPKHIYDIVNYVKQYRDTSSVSIFRNIQAEDKSRFVFFEGGYIGLKSKSYAPSDINFKRVAGTNFRIEVLKKFNGWDYGEVIAHYVYTYNYTTVQVISIFEKKRQIGEIILNEDNKLMVLKASIP